MFNSLKGSNKLLLLCFGGLFAGYFVWTLWQSISIQYADNEASTTNFGQAFMGIVIILASILLLAYFNFRFPFQQWFLLKQMRNWYYIWIILLTWGIFELLQLRTAHEIDFVDENWLVTIGIVGIILILTYIADTVRVRRLRLVLEQQKIKAELKALQAQINPHFLFNALNLIYNEADATDNIKVVELVQQLAGILRFTLQESQEEFTAIKHEIEFLKKYIALQKARLPTQPNLTIETHIEYDEQPAQIAPFLLLPFMENAF